MQKSNSIFSAVVLVSALGYFVDVFDLILFGMVRVASLKSIGIVDQKQIESIGLMLDNYQMTGMLLGGILWGIVGDKKGRLFVLFGSILTYSIANIANGFINSTEWYAFWRFIAGLGLAGELGAGVTLVSEALSKEKRGLGTSLVAAVGVLGAVFGAVIVKSIGLENWRISYVLGGAMGLVLLLLRFNVSESYIFEKTKKSSVSKGNFMLLLKKERFVKYLSIIFIALPIWYLVQLYAKYSPELAEAVGLTFKDKSVIAPNAIMCIYLGISFGDITSGLLSNYLKSRKKAILLFLLFMLLAIGIFWTVGIKNEFYFYASISLLGFTAGYWAVFMSVAAEHFGTNIRSTVTNTAPNFVRGFVIIINFFYLFFKREDTLGLNSIESNLLVGGILFALAFWGWTQLNETFGKDLNYEELD